MNLSPKTITYRTAKTLGLFALARWLTRKGTVIMGWHGVSMDDEHDRFPQFFISREKLSQRIAYLKKHYTVISLDEFMTNRAAGKVVPRTSVLTFDDGLNDFATEAVPVMKQHGVTGTVYCVSGYFENNLAAGMALKDIYLRRQQALGGHPSVVAPADVAEFQQRKAEIESLPRSEQDAYLLKIADEKQVDFAPILKSDMWRNMSREELKALVDDGFDVQVHTHSHRTTVSALDKVEEEAATCRRMLEEAVGRPTLDFCYPSGLWEHGAWPGLRNAGMRGAVTCKTGPNFPKTPDLALRRYIDHQENSQLEFEAMVSGFHWLLKVMRRPDRFYEPSVALNEGPPYF